MALKKWVVPFNKMFLFSKDLITFIISFISLFDRVIPEPEIDEIPLLIFLPSKLSPVSTRISYCICLATIFFYSFTNEFANEKSYLIVVISGLSVEPSKDILGSINAPECTILDDWVFGNVILAVEPFGKALGIFETCVSVSNNLYGKLVSSLKFPIKFDERLKFTSVPFLLQILTY